MSDNTIHTTGGDERVSAYNVISASFDPDTNAYAALTALKELDAQGRLSLEAAAVVVRDAEGHLDVKDQIGANEFEGAAGGGLIGLLIGVIGGPLGVLIGGTYGMLVGSLLDFDEIERSGSVLGELSASVKPGHTALLAQVTEQSPEVVDSAVARLGGTVLRRPVAEVEAEIAVAEQAQREAKREANKELVRSRSEHNKQQVHAKVEQLKAKLPHRDKATSAGS